jgi:hypothetical protein
MAYGVVDVQIHISFSSALAGVEWTISRPCRFSPGEKPPVAIRSETVGLRSGLDDLEKILDPTSIRNPTPRYTEYAKADEVSTVIIILINYVLFWISSSWHITPCSVVKVNRSFREMYRPHVNIVSLFSYISFRNVGCLSLD